MKLKSNMQTETNIDFFYSEYSGPNISSEKYPKLTRIRKKAEIELALQLDNENETRTSLKRKSCLGNSDHTRQRKVDNKSF